MGAAYVDVTIRNPADPLRSWTGKFLVDTGACDSLVPRTHLTAIGLQPRGRREYVLADGKAIPLDITIAEIEFEGEIVGGTIIYGDDDAEPLLGVTALESGGFEVDPRSESLKRLPAVLLKACRRRSKTSSAHWFRLLPASSAARAALRRTSGLMRNITWPEKVFCGSLPILAQVST